MTTLINPDTQAPEIPDSVAKARTWVNQLPLNNFSATTRLIYQCITGLNKYPLNPIRRIEVTEVIRPYVELILDHLAKHLTERSFPLPKKSRKIFDLHQSLLIEVAGAYQLSALEMLTKDNVNKKILLISTGRALGYMGRVLTMTYSVYIQPSETIWRDIHHLYLIAVEQNISQSTIPSKSSITPHCETIEDIYKLISLAALSSPFTLRIGDIDRVMKFFPHMLSKVSIHHDPDQLNQDYAHTVMLNSDEPAALMPTAELLFSPTIRIIDTAPIVTLLEEFTERAAESSSTTINVDSEYPMMTTSLAERLIKTLTIVQNRQHKRFERDDKAAVVHQILPIAKVIQYSLNNDGTVDEEAEADEMYNNLIYGNALSSTSPWVEEDVEIDEMENETGVKLRSWNILNSSSKGYGLCWAENDPVSARVGELIAIQDPTDGEGQWQIGNIRWMQYFINQGLCVGVELLALTAKPFTVEAITNRTISQKLPITGLYLPPEEGIQEEAQLILPDYMFKVGDTLTMNLNAVSQNIEVIECDEQSGAFARCRFIHCDNNHAHAGASNLEFEDLWEDL